MKKQKGNNPAVKYKTKRHRRLRSKNLVSAAAIFILTFAFWILAARESETFDPLYASIEEDPSYRDGVFYIYDIKDYTRFDGYINRARKVEKENNEAVAVDVELMADINFVEDRGYGSFIGHPYIRQSMLRYGGVFEGNGHTITWHENAGNGMFVCVDRKAVIRNLTLKTDPIVWEMDEYGVGILCMVNYGTLENITVEGRIEGTQCYVGGIAGINRGTIKDCENRAEVFLSGIGDYGAGGIAGLNKCKVLKGEDEQNPVPAIIKNCVNTGKVEAPWEAGGICAYNDCAFIYDCGNEGTVTAQYQKAYIYPDHPDWYEYAQVAGICGHMGWNSIENCYNTGKISILEEGIQATHGIAGDTLDWVCTVSGCVSLKGTATGRMRHESVMELEEEEFRRWKDNPAGIPYRANNWQFDLEEAREKLSLAPLAVSESPLTRNQAGVYLCEEFCLRAPEGFSISEVSPFALCMEAEPASASDQMEAEPAGAQDQNGWQMWLLRLPEGQTDINDDLDENGWITKDTVHELWLGISGAHWLHPSFSWEADCHVERTYATQGTRIIDPKNCLVHYRDDILAQAAVGENGEMIDNVVAVPISGNMEDGYQVKWLLLFTNKNNNYRPPLYFVKDALSGFVYLPCQITAAEGDSLYSIAKDLTGEGSRYAKLAAYNQLDVREPLRIGQILRIPEEWLADIP
ncbi:LysM peptidoglycan-binding domain-containing protein [Lachnospiraceae bacterium ASD3451]|nr:LysM peptidoglycan-binding domain-containing protein [Diplocloster agilis]